MKLTSKSNDQHVLVAVAAAVAYLAWVIYEPTMGQCNTLRKFFPIGRVLVYWCWLFYVCVKPKPTVNWSWLKFSVGTFCGGFALAIGAIIFGLFSGYPEGNILQKVQPIVEIAPYAATSGIVAAYENNIKRAGIAAFLILFYQMAADFIIWLPWSCVY